VDIVIFLALSAVNIGLIALNLWIWGIASAEGVLMSYYGATVISDNADLIYDYLFNFGALPLGTEEFAMRIYPTEVYIAAMIVLMAGLFVSNPHRVSIRMQLDEAGRRSLRKLGWAMACLGMTLFIVGVVISGGLEFRSELQNFRGTVMPYGGFWYRGVDIVLIGMSFVFAATSTEERISYLPLMAIAAAAFFLTSNKGGVEKAFLWGGFSLYVFNGKAFKAIVTPRRVAAAIAVSYLCLGAKGLWLARSSDDLFSFDRISNGAWAPFSDRFSDVGDYRSFSQFLDALPSYQNRWQDFEVGKYTLMSLIPRVLYPNRPRNPFWAIAVMTHKNFTESSSMETEAPGWAGTAMADDGYYSLVIYLLLTGILLGLLRQAAASSAIHIERRAAYLLWIMLGGFSSESGITSIPDILVLAICFTAGAEVVVAISGYLLGSTRLHGAPGGFPASGLNR
jgi:hypothetical protein